MQDLDHQQYFSGPPSGLPDSTNHKTLTLGHFAVLLPECFETEPGARKGKPAEILGFRVLGRSFQNYEAPNDGSVEVRVVDLHSTKRGAPTLFRCTQRAQYPLNKDKNLK